MFEIIQFLGSAIVILLLAIFIYVLLYILGFILYYTIITKSYEYRLKELDKKENE